MRGKAEINIFFSAEGDFSLEARIWRYYQKYAPQKAATAAEEAAKYAGKEEQLSQVLLKKYKEPLPTAEIAQKLLRCDQVAGSHVYTYSHHQHHRRCSCHRCHCC